MKIKIFFVVFTLLLLPGVVLGAGSITLDMIPRGTDFSSVKCDGGTVYREDLARDVVERCGEPDKVTRIHDEPYRIWVYRFDQSDYIYILAFMHEKIQRIYRAKCPQGNSGCP